MARIMTIITGLILMGLGVWGIIVWWGAIIAVLKAVVAIAAVLLGIGIFIFGLSELWVGQPKSVPPSAAAMPEGPGEPA